MTTPRPERVSVERFPSNSRIVIPNEQRESRDLLFAGILTNPGSLHLPWMRYGRPQTPGEATTARASAPMPGRPVPGAHISPLRCGIPRTSICRRRKPRCLTSGTRDVGFHATAQRGQKQRVPQGRHESSPARSAGKDREARQVPQGRLAKLLSKPKPPAPESPSASPRSTPAWLPAAKPPIHPSDFPPRSSAPGSRPSSTRPPARR